MATARYSKRSRCRRSSARWLRSVTVRPSSTRRIGASSTTSAKTGPSAGIARSSVKVARDIGTRAMAYLELDGVGKQFGAQTVVDDFSLAVRKGEFISFLGPSGCGKTTTLQMIAGFLDLSHGAIRLEGRDLTRVHPAERGLGIVFQSYALFPHMTAAENVAFGLEMRRVPRSERAERVRAALVMVGLSGYEERYPRRMSGGQQQRVALARALVILPSVLLLDEPLSNLDATLREEMRFEIRRLHDEFHVTTVYVTHDQAEAMVTSDRIAVMNHGRI